MAAISADPFELEAMREEDGSWQPCHVSLSSGKASCGIIVYFESNAEEEIISNRKDVLRRLRFRSLPLQDGECFCIKEGECVLAMHKVQSRSFFFDAVIEKIYKVRHSSRVFCRCTFEIKWLNRELNGKCMTLSWKSIMKLSKKNISSHPVIDVFLTAFSPTNGVEVPPFLSLLEETNCDVDLHGLLDKQIEEISKLADKSKESTDNILLGDKKGASRNSFTRSTWSRKKQEAEMEIKKHLEDKPFLSPLAARAALASLMHEVPQKPNILIRPIEIEDYLNSTVKDPKNHIKEQSLDVSCILANYDASIQDNMLVASNPSQNTKFDSPVEAPSSASNRTASMKKNSQFSPTIVERNQNSVRECKLNGHAITSRITRSAGQKVILDSAAEVAQASKDSEGKMTRPTIVEHVKSSVKDCAVTTTRTHSAVPKEVLDSTAEVARSYKESEGKLDASIEDNMLVTSNPSQDTKIDSPVEAPSFASNRTASMKKNSQSSPTIVERNQNSVRECKLNGRAITSRITRSVLQKVMLDSAAEVAQASEDSERKMSSLTIVEHVKSSVTDCAVTTRKTRSAVPKEVVDSTAEVARSSKEPEGKLGNPTIIEHMGNSMTDVKLNSRAMTTRTRSAVQKEIVDSTAEVARSSKELVGKLSSPTIIDEMGNSATYGKLNGHAITPRITRSVAVQKGILYSTAEVAHGSVNEKRGSTMNSRLEEGSKDLSVEDLDTPDKDENKKKFISPPLEFPDTVSPLDSRKRTRESTAAIVNDEDQGKISQNNGSFPAMKKRAASLKKPTLRFSPRLKFLPRTRSLKQSSPTC